VFVDNYLDGGYHVEILHKDLTTALDIDSYTTEVGEGFSIQVPCLQGDQILWGKIAQFPSKVTKNIAQSTLMPI
jgi:hypothetical protein